MAAIYSLGVDEALVQRALELANGEEELATDLTLNDQVEDAASPAAAVAASDAPPSIRQSSLLDLTLHPKSTFENDPPSESPTVNQAGKSSRFAVMIRSCRGDGRLHCSLEFEEEAAPSVKINDLKELLCLPPHSLCREASSLVLVLNQSVLKDDAALVDMPLSRGTVITAVTVNPDYPTNRHNRARLGSSQECAISGEAHAHDLRSTHAGDLFLLVDPRLREAYSFWRTVEQFYHNHVPGDGCIDYSLVPSGVTELHFKFFAYTEHVMYANQHLMTEAMNRERDLSDHDKRFCSDFIQSVSTVGMLIMQLGTSGYCEPLDHSQMFQQFRRTRLSIFGLKNATWLNGAEAVIHDVNSTTQSKTALWLYWPPNAVKRNGGKKALLNLHENTGHVLNDLEHMFEHFPEEFAGLLSREINGCKRVDSLCRVYLALVDFSRVPNWHMPETLYRLQRDLRAATRDFTKRTLERMLRDWFSLFTQQQVERKVKEGNIRLNTHWGCFLDCFPEVQLEVSRAISCLSDYDADTHIQIMLQAEDLLPSSDTLLNKFGLDLDLLAGSESMSAAGPSQAKAAGIYELSSKYMSDSERENFGKLLEFEAMIKSFVSERKDSFVLGLKSLINKLFEVFLFLIFRDRKEALRIISTRDFFFGVHEQSGGNFLLHLFSVFTWKCFQDIETPNLSISFSGFKSEALKVSSLRINQYIVLSRIPVAVAILLHRDVCAHHLSCNCLQDGIWFPCNWPHHIKSQLLSFRIFQNLEKCAPLRRLFGHHSLFLELKPQIFVKPIDSVALIKFAWKLWSDDLTVSKAHRVVGQPCLQALEEDLKRESLGRSILAADRNAAELIASFFEADELDDICRYIHIRRQCLDHVPVRIVGLQKDVYLNGAEGVSDLTININGRCRVQLQSPLHVVGSCPNGIASVDISKLEFLGQNVSEVAFFAAFNSMRQKIDFLKIFKFISEKLPKMVFAAVHSLADAKQDTHLKAFLSEAKHDTHLKAFLSEVGPLERRTAEDAHNSETQTAEHLKDVSEIADFLLGLVNNLPFISTIKHLMCQVLGSVGFWVRLLSNPSSRREALDYLRIQVRVLTSFDIPPAFLDAINGFLDSANATRSKKTSRESSEKSSQPSQDVKNDLFENFRKQTQELSETLQLDPNVVADIFTSIQSAIAGDNFVTALMPLWNQMRQPYEQFKQSGMPDALARVASFDQTIAQDPGILLGLQNCAVGSNERDSFGFTKFFPKEVDGNSLVSDIPDDLDLVTDQRIVIKSDYIPAFLAGAEGTILKRHDTASEVYEVLIKKPASAVFNCHGERVRKIGKKHLQMLGKHLPKLDFSKDWIDEQDRLQLKNVTYWMMCPKSHPLHCAVPTIIDHRINFCSTCGRALSDETRSFCESGCAYSVCVECQLLLQRPAPLISPAPSSDDDAYVHVRFFSCCSNSCFAAFDICF
jgi:hypothetical protein